MDWDGDNWPPPRDTPADRQFQRLWERQEALARTITLLTIGWVITTVVFCVLIGLLAFGVIGLR